MTERTANGHYFHKEHVPQRVLAVGLYYSFVRKPNLEGIDNIQKAESLLADKKKVVILSNHLSHGDAELIRQALKKNGLEQPLIFLVGEKLIQRLWGRWLAGSQNAIHVWPKSLTPKDEEEAKKDTMNFKALHDSRKALKEGRVLIVFPEGGRSYGGTLMEADSGLSRFLKAVKADFVLPIGISGIEKKIPPKKIPSLKFWKRVDICVNVGQPIEVTSLFKQYENWPEDEKYLWVMDDIMRKGIAPLLPPPYKGVYA